MAQRSVVNPKTFRSMVSATSSQTAQNAVAIRVPTSTRCQRFWPVEPAEPSWTSAQIQRPNPARKIEATATTMPANVWGDRC
jgi:hypothetical protein